MATRTTTHRRTRTQSVVALIERDSKILMQKHCEHIADPGTWILPVADMTKGEDHEEALIRECIEGLGMNVSPSKNIGKIVLAGASYPIWHVEWKTGEPKTMSKSIAAVGWFTMDELLTLEPVRYQEEFRSFIIACQKQGGALQPQAEDQDEKAEEQAKLAELIARAKNDDHDAFAEIYDQFATPIYRYVAFRVPREMADDLVSDIFVKAWEKLGSYKVRKGVPFSSWLFRIARNVVIDTYRTKKETSELDEFHEDEDRWNNPKLGITQDVQRKLLRQAMTKLPNRYREILLLSFMSELSNTEVARAMRLTEGSVRILKHRALKKLEGLLPASMRDELP